MAFKERGSIFMNHITLGKLGEEAAISYLENSGYKINHRNFRSKFGEIDIIAKIADQIVFVEVKTRRNFSFGTPSEAVNYHKQQKIIRTAFVYLNRFCLSQDIKCRFDIIEVFLEKEKGLRCVHLKNAFSK